MQEWYSRREWGRESYYIWCIADSHTSSTCKCIRIFNFDRVRFSANAKTNLFCMNIDSKANQLYYLLNSYFTYFCTCYNSARTYFCAATLQLCWALDRVGAQPEDENGTKRKNETCNPRAKPAATLDSSNRKFMSRNSRLKSILVTRKSFGSITCFACVMSLT